MTLTVFLTHVCVFRDRAKIRNATHVTKIQSTHADLHREAQAETMNEHVHMCSTKSIGMHGSVVLAVQTYKAQCRKQSIAVLF
jgi:hypothetical protein